MAAPRTLPVAQAHAAGTCLIPVADMHVGMQERVGALFVRFESGDGRRPKVLAAVNQALGDDVRRPVKSHFRGQFQFKFGVTDQEPLCVGHHPLVFADETR